MNMYEIEKGIEIPQKPSSGKSKYTLLKLEMGESFIVPLNNDAVAKVQSRLASAAAAAAKNTSKRFTVRVVNDGIRVWRTE